MADYSSVFSGGGPTFNPSSYGDFGSVFSSSGPTFNPGTFGGGYDFSPSVSYEAPAASKPGFDWGALVASLQDLGAGAVDIIRAVRGEPVYGNRMAGGSYLQNYLKAKPDLAQALKDAAAKSAKDKDNYLRISDSTQDLMGDFNLTKDFNLLSGL